MKVNIFNYVNKDIKRYLENMKIYIFVTFVAITLAKDIHVEFAIGILAYLVMTMLFKVSKASLNNFTVNHVEKINISKIRFGIAV